MNRGERRYRSNRKIKDRICKYMRSWGRFWDECDERLKKKSLSIAKSRYPDGQPRPYWRGRAMGHQSERRTFRSSFEDGE